METSVRSDLLRGVIKDNGELGLVMVLDAGRMIEQEFEALALDRIDRTGFGGEQVDASAEERIDADLE